MQSVCLFQAELAIVLVQKDIDLGKMDHAMVNIIYTLHIYIYIYKYKYFILTNLNVDLGIIF